MSNIPDDKVLAQTLDKVAYTLDRAYINRLKDDYDVVPFQEYREASGGLCYTDNIRIVRVKRWVKDTEEKIIDCFKNVLGVFAATSGNNVALIIKRTPQSVDMFFAIRNTGKNKNGFSLTSCELMIASLEGNFNGSHFEKIDPVCPQKKPDCENCENSSPENCKKNYREIFDESKINSISVVCGIPSEKSENFVTQGIEKLLEGLVPSKEEESYTLIILAEPVSAEASRGILNGYEEIATALTPFVTNQFQYSQNEGSSSGTSDAVSATRTISDAITKTHSVNASVTVGVGGSVSPVNASASVGYGYSNGKTHSEAYSDTTTSGTNYMLTEGSAESTTYTYKSYPIANLVEKAEKTIKRIQLGQSNGLWKYASYVISPSSFVSKNVAGYISALSQGDESYIELPAINEWSKYSSSDGEKKNENNIFLQLIEYIKYLSHPMLANKADRVGITPTAYVSTSELSALYAFPKKSTQGLPVIECARFGREPHALVELNGDIELGHSYHMYTIEENNSIFLNKDELTKHTFITGSTGSGKSNAIYVLINRLCFGEKLDGYGKTEKSISAKGSKTKPQDTKFLIIEPTKGEYKDVFGGRKDVTTYGTNPSKFPNLLQINPFSFPEDIHVLEHIDRLVEVFNACWPMYAAMPAILKEAVEKAYEYVGWNLKHSRYINTFPTFSTLLSVLPGVIDSSGYSSDTSNDYKGALLTRVRSLTHGIHGQIFSGDSGDKELFDENVIIDISRIGSSETKALIMGILVLKLQEYRMSSKDGANSRLRHVTVLEEAHNLLRRTSSEQSQESSNLQGKSVEMLANAIAEMRTYGEGFIIADQSPGLMDMSVIRNTNTKIILRLPDEGDRQLVGKAAGLNDAQIAELARLEVGVAAISQSDWLEPVLCKVCEFNLEGAISFKERYAKDEDKPFANDRFSWWQDEDCAALQQFISEAFKPADIERAKLSLDVADRVRAWYQDVGVREAARICAECVLDGQPLEGKQKMALVVALVGERMYTIPDRETAVSVVMQSLMDQYAFQSQDETLRHIRNLFETHFPIKPIPSFAERDIVCGGDIK